jgi:hypothetical protein
MVVLIEKERHVARCTCLKQDTKLICIIRPAMSHDQNELRLPSIKNMSMKAATEQHEE